jgi:hypothetical protein
MEKTHVCCVLCIVSTEWRLTAGQYSANQTIWTSFVIPNPSPKLTHFFVGFYKKRNAFFVFCILSHRLGRKIQKWNTKQQFRFCFCQPLGPAWLHRPKIYTSFDSSLKGESFGTRIYWKWAKRTYDIKVRSVANFCQIARKRSTSVSRHQVTKDTV